MAKHRLFDCALYRGGIKTQGLIELCQYVKQSYALENKRVIKIADVGCYAGESTLIIQNIFQPGCSVVCIDDWNPDNLKSTGRNNLVEEMKHAQLNFNARIKGVKGISSVFRENAIAQSTLIKIPNQLFDFIHLDTVTDIDLYKIHVESYLPKLKIGGFLAGSDYNLFENPDKIFSDGSWCKKF